MTNYKRATRGDGLHLVPSQVTERYKAIDVPRRERYDILEGDEAPSRVDAFAIWYENQSPRTLAAYLLLGAFAIFAAYLIVTYAR